jgi:DNA-binding beta-propeller fold protein YncE
MANLFWTQLSRLVVLLLIATGGLIAAQDRAAPPFQLEYVDSAVDGELDAPTSVVVSPDGRFVYASAYKSGSHAVFARDQKTGTLKVVQTVKMDHLAGSTSLRLSKDGKLAAAASFGGRAISLYTRNDETGLLTLVDTVRAGVPANVKLQFPVDVAFSPDLKYVDVADRNGWSYRVGVRVWRHGDSRRRYDLHDLGAAWKR